MVMRLAPSLKTVDYPGRTQLTATPRTALPIHYRWWMTVRGWTERQRQRHALAALDDRLLADIGVTRYEVAREVAKPFWR